MRRLLLLDSRARRTGLLVALMAALMAACSPSQAAGTTADAPAPTTAALVQAASALDGWAWRGVGDPLMLDQAIVLFGLDDKTQKPVARRLDWRAGGRVTDMPLDGLRLDKDLRYSAAANSAGIWLAGPALALLRPDGQLLQTPPGLLRVQRPPLVALADGSALVFKSVELEPEGASHILRARLSADGKRLEVQRVALLSYDGRPNTAGRNYSVPTDGHGTQLLADGRVLMFGDDRTPRLASIFDPATAGMTPVPPMPNDRAVAGSLRLDDGRVVVAGAPSLRCYHASARKVDLYDVGRNSWASLPDLPLPLCAEAYGAWAPSLVQASDGSLVLGGGLEPELLVLTRDAKGPLGFASHWRRVGWLAKDRIGGRLQALPGARVAVVGGVHTSAGASCCERTPGVDVIDLKAAEAPFAPGGLTLNGPGVAQRGQRLFIAGGRRFQMTGSGQMRYASHAEVLDLRSGLRTQLPALPVVAGALDAFWIDDDRVIVKGILARSDRGFDSDLASYMPAGSDKLAVYSFSTNRWTTLSLADVRAARLIGVVRLAGRDEPAAVIAAADGLRLLRLGQRAGDTPRLERWPGAVDAAVGTTRILADNRLVIGRELAASDRVSVLDPACEGRGDASQVPAGCAETFVDIGLPQPANILQIVSLDDPKAGPQQVAGPPPDGLVRNAVTATGDVVQLAWQDTLDAEGKRKPGAAGITKGWALRRWRADARPASAWENLPVPTTWTRSEQGLGERECGSGVSAHGEGSMRCQLLALDDPRDPRGKSSLIFLRSTQANQDVAWSDLASSPELAASSVRWYDEAGRRWVEVLKMNGQAARHVPQTLKGMPGSRLKSIGWHLDRPALWAE